MEQLETKACEAEADSAVELSLEDLDRVGGGRIGSGGSGAPILDN